MKRFLSLWLGDVGKTLAMTVGSPSAHRRGTMLKHVAFLLLFLFAGFGQIWADETVTYTVSTASSVTTTGTAPTGSSAVLSGTAGVNGGMLQITYGKNAVLTLKGYEGCTITGFKMSMKSNSSKGKGSMTLKAGETTLHSVSDANFNSNSWYGSWSTSAVDVDFTSVMTTDYTVDEDEDIVITVTNHGTSNTTNSLYIGSYTITYEISGGGAEEPTVSADPEEVTDVVAAGVNNQSISLSYENISGYTTEVSVHPNADGTGTLSPAWLSASVSDADDYATVTYSVDANDGDARTAYIKVYTTDGEAEAETIIPVSQVKYTAPTGTFVKYTGDIVEGDYVLVGSADALKNSITSNRFDCGDVTISSNQIINPDASIIWHISSDGDYWNLYNAAIKKYASATTSKNQGALADEVDDNHEKWNIAKESNKDTYTFINVGRAGDTNDNGNKYLARNATATNKYWATYASGQTNPTLYKKALPKHAVTFSAATNGTFTVSVGGSDISSGDQVEEGSTVTITPTPSTYYRIASVTKGGQAIEPVQEGVYSFTMPTSDVAIAVTFEYISVTQVTVTPASLTLVVGESSSPLSATVLPNNALGTVTWSSANSNIASVNSETGVVTAVAASENPVNIIATSTVTGTVFGTCAVTVNAPTGNPVTISQVTGGTVTANVDVSDVLEGTSVTLTATPSAGYSVSGWTIVGVEEEDLTISQDKTTCSFDMPDGEVLAEASFTHEEAVLKLHDANGERTFDSPNTHYWKESVTLPETAATCSKTFVGWSADENRATAPEIAKGASYTIPNKGTNHLYAVYAASEDEDVTITPSAVSSGDDPHTITIDQAGYTLSANKNSGSSAPTWNSTASDVRIYAKGDITLTSSKTMKSIVFNLSTQGLTRLAPITASEGAIATQASDDETVTWTGSATSVTFTVGDYATYGSDGASKAGQLDFSTIDVVVAGEPSDYSTTCAQKLDAPTFSPEAGMYTTAQTIHISAAEGATIYYTTDGTKPSTSSNVFSADIELNTRAITTIKAIAAKTDYANSNVASATYNINLPFTVAEAIDLIPNDKDERADTYIDGIVCTAGTSVSSGAMTYYISDNGSADGAKIRIYSGKGLNNENFSATTDLKVGDKVRVFGKLNNYNGSYDMDDSYLTSLEVASVSSVAISGTASKTAYSAEDNSFSFAGLTAAATYNTGYVKDVTNEDGVWSTNLSENVVTEAGDVTVTATFGSKSDSKVVTVTYTSKTVESISLSYSAKIVYVGAECPEPVVTASYEEAIDDENVSDLATFDKSAYVANTAGTYTINVSYQGKNASYTVTVKAIANDQATAYTAEEAIDIITNAYKSTSESSYEVYVKGIVVSNPNNSGTYYISATGTSENQFTIWQGKYFSTSESAKDNVKAGDDVIVKGKIQYYNSSTPELKSSTVVSQLRAGALTITDVTDLEVGQDLDITDLITKESTGAVTLNITEEIAEFVTAEGLVLHGVKEGNVEITANLAAVNTEGVINYTGASKTFNVTIVPAQVRYAVTFDLNEGSADPEMSLGDQLENANVVIPAGTFTKDGYKFNGWTVMAGETPVEVTETAGVYSFTMPAAAVTITAQWQEGSDFEWVVSEQGYTGNGTKITTASESPISIVFDKNGGNNDPAFYTDAIRMYKSNTVTISTAAGDKLITGVTITFDSGNTCLSGNGLTVTGTTGTWSGLAKELTFTDATSGSDKAYVKAITVTYINGTVTTLAIENVSLKLSEVTKDLSIDCNVNPVPAISYEIATADQAIATVEDGVVTAHAVGGPINVTANIAQGSNYTAAVANFTITVTEKTQPTMSFPAASYNANLGSDFVEPILTTDPEGITVTYSSNETSVATVDEATGVITLVGEGETVITAAFAGNDNYSANSATYTLNVADPNKDVLTAEKIAVTGSYDNWSDKTFGSGVKYAGNSTTGTSDNAGAIQMRVSSGTQEKSGIVTTTAIGYLKSISATRKSGSNYLDVYAKSSAYESAADLYDNDKRGTLIGTINNDAMVFDGTKSYADNYKYIGIRSHSGAVYYDDITITWEPAEFASYNVTYKPGEGTGENVVESIEEGSLISLKAANTFTAPEGKMFAGWKLEDVEEEAREAGSKYTVTAAVTFVAQWINVYTITYLPGEADGEPVVVENVPVGNYSLAAANTFEAPTSKEFAGWLLEGEEDVREAASNYTVSGDASFTAQWSIIKQEAGLAYEPTSYTIVKGNDFEAPELTKPNGVEVIYSGDKDEVATVNPATGAITLQGGIGTVTITATFAGNDYYYADEASYTLTVKEVNLAGDWTRLTSTNDLINGMKVIIAEHVSTTAIKTMGAQNTNNRTAVSSTLDNEGKLVSNEGTAIFTLVKVGETANTYALKTADNKYLYAAGSGSGKNYLRSQAKIDDNATWTISLSADGKATITAQGDNTNNKMQYNQSSTLFSCYATSQKEIALYSKTVGISSGETNASTLEDYADVVVEDGATLVVDDANTTVLGEIIVQSGATVTVNTTANTGNITVENGGTITVNAATTAEDVIVENGGVIDATETVSAQNLYIQADATGSSAQVVNAANIALATGGDVFFDLKLGAAGKRASQWHAFTVPFEVDALNGIFDKDDNKLTNEVNYAIMDYHGDIRANGQYGWKKYRGILQPGVFYIMTVDSEREVYRFKKANNDAFAAPATEITINAYGVTGTEDANSDHGWNGVGNPNLVYGKVNATVQVLDPDSYEFEDKDANDVNFTVGTPFFYQAKDADPDPLTISDGDNGNAYAPARVVSNEVKTRIYMSNENYSSRLTVTANEDALNQYQLGEDLVKMTMTNTPRVPSITAQAYNMKLCRIYTPLVNDNAEVALTLYAPAAGEYTISAEENANATVYLLHEGAIIWNLSASAYTADFAKGNNAGYSIRIVKAPQVETGIGNVQGDNAQCTKVMIDEHVFILRGEKLFDVTGKAVK